MTAVTEATVPAIIQTHDSGRPHRNRRTDVRGLARWVMRGRVLLIAVFSMLTVGAVVGAAPAAQAAVPSYGTMKICFQSSYTLYGTTYWGTYNRPFNIDTSVGGTAYQMATYTPDTRGCAVVNVPANNYWRFRVYYHESLTWYVGQSGWQYVANNVFYTFPTLRLSSIRG